MSLYHGDWRASLLNLAYVFGLVTIGGAIGLRLHGGYLIGQFCEVQAGLMGPTCQQAVFLTNRLSLGVGLVGIALLAVAFGPIVFWHLSDTEGEADAEVAD